jgi:predicted nucleotide-binding protein
MGNLTAELRQIFDELDAFGKKWKQSGAQGVLDKLSASGKQVGQSWSKSWIGYQARVYYKGLQAPPPGQHFSSEWGFNDGFGGQTGSNFEEFKPEHVEAVIFRRAGDPDLEKVRTLAGEGQELLEQRRSDVVSILQTAGRGREDPFIDKLGEEAGKIRSYKQGDAVGSVRPKSAYWSRDVLAMSQGLWTPPHISVLADVASIQSAFDATEKLARLCNRAFSHIERQAEVKVQAGRIGTKVFIGHGRSKEWKDLKDFIADRMRLPWDEFNRVAVAGIPNAARLKTMLDAAAIAFLVLTGEDETADGKVQARMNVIHEAGLFQGRLGFERAIIMLEDGCEEFSNIHGIGQIRFPKGNIKAAFHDVQLVLEREGLIDPP